MKLCRANHTIVAVSPAKLHRRGWRHAYGRTQN